MHVKWRLIYVGVAQLLFSLSALIQNSICIQMVAIYLLLLLYTVMFALELSKLRGQVYVH